MKIDYMKKLKLLVAALLAGWTALAGPTHKVQLSNGLTVGVEACSDGIFRVKVSPRSDFSESLMERYGLLTTNWEAVKEKVSTDGRTWTLTTPTHKLVLDKKTGNIRVLTADGKTLIEGVEYVPGKDRKVASLAKVINDKYANLHVVKNDGIIGDDTNKKEKKDNAESGEPADASLLRFALGKEERFYGGGSTSREHIQHRGELLRMWTTYQHTEIPMPFVMSSRGWGVFNNATRKNFFDIGYTEKDVFNIFNTFDEADFYLLCGTSMKDVLRLYTCVTGGNYVLPKWAYGLCFGPNMREDQWDILNDAVFFRQLQVPCDVFWLEPQWMEKRYDFSTSKRWNFDKFSPEP
jgi:alpha-glucosidase (family GH31 glycosyl hydrolase)